MIERIYDMMTVGLVFAINLLWLKPVTASGSDFSLARKIGMVLVGVLFVTLALLFWFERSAPTVLEWLESRIPARSSLMARLKRGVLSTLEQLATALKVLSDVRLLAVSIFWSLMLWGFVAFGNLLVFRAFGVPFGMTEVLFVLGWSMIGSVVPTPGGAAGAFHAATGTAMVLLGVDGNHAAAIAIILHLVDFAPAALFGLYYFLRGDINLSRLRALLRVKAVESAIEDQPATASGAAR
jgi:uncharacterized protein (TIRG00374 family)